MADASYLRKTATLPTAGGRNMAAIRFNTTTTEPTISNTANWVPLIYFDLVYRQQPNAELATEAFFIANRACQVLNISEVHSTAGTDAGAVSIQVTKDTSTNAPGAGTALLTNNTNVGFNAKGTANTVQTGTLTATTASLKLAIGDRLSVAYTGTLTSLAGVVVTATLKYI